MHDPIYLTDEHRMLRNQLRRFIEAEVTPNGDEWEAAGMVPRESLKRMGELGFFGAKSSTVNTGGVGFVGGAITDGGGHLDDRWLIGHCLGGCDRLGDGIHVGVAIGHVLHMPAVGLIALQHVLGEGHIGAAVNRDVVVVVEGNQFAQLEVTSQRASLG